MTRKDYALIAKAIAGAKASMREHGFSSEHIEGVDYLTGYLAGMLGQENPRFDKRKFYEACRED